MLYYYVPVVTVAAQRGAADAARFFSLSTRPASVLQSKGSADRFRRRRRRAAVRLIEKGIRFAIREGGKPVGARLETEVA
jgi:hypothetical protein